MIYSFISRKYANLAHLFAHVRYHCVRISTLVIKKKLLSLQCRIEFCNPHTGAMTHTMTSDDDAPLSTSGDCTQSVNSNKGYMYIPTFTFFFSFRRGHWHCREIAEACSRFGAEIVLKRNFRPIVTRRSQWDASLNESLFSCDFAEAQEIPISTHRWWVVLPINSNLRWFSNLLFSIFSMFCFWSNIVNFKNFKLTSLTFWFIFW